MNVLVFGSGVIGTTFAWQLQESGCDVSLFVRKLRMVRYAHSGVAINYTDMRGGKKEFGQTVFRPRAIDKLDPKKPFDLIIVAVRSNQYADVIPYIAKYSGNADILFLGNSWDEMRLADKHLHKGRYFLGFPGMVAGGHIENGISCYLFAKGHTLLGETNGRPSKRLEQTAALMDKAGLRAAQSTTIKDWLAYRYLVSAILPGLISKAGNARLFASSKTLIRQYITALKEGHKLCRKRGIAKPSLFPFKYFFLPDFMLVRMIKNELKEEVLASMDAHMKHGAEEKKNQYFNVLNTAKRLKVPVPYWASFEKYMDFS